VQFANWIAKVQSKYALPPQARTSHVLVFCDDVFVGNTGDALVGDLNRNGFQVDKASSPKPPVQVVQEPVLPLEEEDAPIPAEDPLPYVFFEKCVTYLRVYGSQHQGLPFLYRGSYFGFFSNS
jgi:hypothetical protein